MFEQGKTTLAKLILRFDPTFPNTSAFNTMSMKYPPQTMLNIRQKGGHKRIFIMLKDPRARRVIDDVKLAGKCICVSYLSLQNGRLAKNIITFDWDIP